MRPWDGQELTLPSPLERRTGENFLEPEEVRFPNSIGCSRGADARQPQDGSKPWEGGEVVCLVAVEPPFLPARSILTDEKVVSGAEAPGVVETDVS